MNSNFRTEIISPKEIIFSSEVKEVVIPGIEGEMTILFEHIPLITFLRPGIVKINASKEIQYFLEEGTVEFSNNNLTILSSTIIEVSALSRERISKMIEDSKNQLNQENLNDKTRYVVSHKIDCLSRINL